MTDRRLAIAIAQINPTVGDIAGNIALLQAARRTAGAAGAVLVVGPELCVVGYPPEDLVLKPRFVDAAAAAVAALAVETGDGGPALLVGCPWRVDGRLYNAALLLDAGAVTAIRLKHELPNYGVFDEKRVFEPGPLPAPIEFRGVRLGVMICEDMWYPRVAAALTEAGAELLIVPNGSPFETGKYGVRLTFARQRVAESRRPLVYVNQVGGQDELVFDGVSFAIDGEGTERARLPFGEPALAMTRWRRPPAGADSGGANPAGADSGGANPADVERRGPAVATGWRWDDDDSGNAPAPAPAPLPGAVGASYGAMVLGLRDYVGKNRFPGVVLGLSGGIDSALSAAVAVDALGAERVHCVMMPSVYTSQESLEEAEGCARRLGVRLDTVPIDPAVAAFSAVLAPLFAGRPADTTEENIQSRVRGLILMAISNKLGAMVLTTGNKSEMSVGYATIYGDMCGGYSVLKDVYKTAVYRLARWRNRERPPGALGPEGPVIPERTLTRPATAELRPNQTDQDSLPPYAVLDAILEGLVEREESVADLVAQGNDRDTVLRVERLLHAAEYKRRQAPPGVKMTSRNFGRDRRYPITNRFRDG